MKSRQITDRLSTEAARLFGAVGTPVYIAGGHEWSDGTVYQASHPLGALMLKLIPDASQENILGLIERLEFFDYLGARGIQVARPLHSVNGSVIETLGDHEEPCIVRAWHKLPGEHIADLHPKNLSEFYQAWGAMIGRMHRLAQELHQWRGSACTDEFGVSLLSWRREWELFYHWLQETAVKQAWEGIKDELERLPVSRASFGFIHNDPHPGNILVNESGLALLDPEVANYHWFMTDLGICLNSEHSRIGHHSKHKEALADLPDLFLRPFMQGYHSQNRLPADEYHRIRLFLRYRRFLMYAVFYEQIKQHDPDYLKGFTRELIDGKNPAADLMETEFIRLSR